MRNVSLPPTGPSFDLRQIVTLRVNGNGDPEWAVLAGPPPRTAVIESEAERQEEKRLALARTAADARVDWTRVRDIHRMPALTYTGAAGCGSAFVYGCRGIGMMCLARDSSNACLTFLGVALSGRLSCDAYPYSGYFPSDEAILCRSFDQCQIAVRTSAGDESGSQPSSSRTGKVRGCCLRYSPCCATSMDLNALGLAMRQILVVGVVLLGASSASAQLRPEQDAIRLAPRELIDRLRSNPTDYFRFVNRPWIARVCEVFAEDIRDQPIVRLHGDAHLEQFAVTKDAWGLDDFDDSARGPALIDLVRFLGSIDLTVRQRGWTSHRKALIDRFFKGYRRGLTEPGYRPPQPAIVGRLRTQAPRSHAAFLAWGAPSSCSRSSSLVDGSCTPGGFAAGMSPTVS
jgi:Uncharacterized protein conserved in bacteria (DUF2252)